MQDNGSSCVNNKTNDVKIQREDEDKYRNSML